MPAVPMIPQRQGAVVAEVVMVPYFIVASGSSVMTMSL
jgi:hypothetical protein